MTTDGILDKLFELQKARGGLAYECHYKEVCRLFKTYSERNAAMETARDSGMTYKDVADLFVVTRERARQIIYRQKRLRKLSEWTDKPVTGRIDPIRV